MADGRPEHERSLLTEAQYQAICAACDSVLLEPDSGDARVAITWLHVIREHPFILSQYADIFGGESLRQALALRVRTRARLLRNLRSMLRRNAYDPAVVSALPRELDVLFVSHLLNAPSAGAEDDFYFGDWPRVLAERGYSVGIALINHSEEKPQELTQRWEGNTIPRLVLSRVLNAGVEWKLLKLLWADAARLRRAARRESEAVRRRVLSRAAIEALSRGAIGSLRIGHQISAIVKRCRPRAIVITHEGHAWERLAFSSARSAEPGIRCIAYQHALVFRLQHAVLRNLLPRYNPDHVLTSGEAARERFISRRHAGPVSVANAGSRRGDLLTSAAVTDRSSTDTAGAREACCVVLPEGIARECHLLLGFAVQCAAVLPEMRFILRLHPLMSFQDLAAENPQLTSLPPNVALSTAPLDDDIARSGWTLYRGSTAAVQAVAAGVTPVYLRHPGELSIDPLYEAGDRVAKVESVAEFAAAIRQPRSASDSAFVRALCARLFSPSDVKRLLECLPSPASPAPAQ